MTDAPASSLSRFPTALFLIGIALRLPGLLFNGMGDMYEILLGWGAAVHHVGLVETFRGGYGILSYAAFGAAETAGEWIPRFWWAPYKLLVMAFDTGVFLALLALVAPRDRRWLVVLVWLNPWFILHGAYYGFWDGPHLLCGLLAVLALRRIADERRAWVVAGALVMCSAMFKPQGLIHFAGPLTLYLAVQYGRGIRRPLVSFVIGFAAIATTTALSIWIAGGPALALYNDYHSVSMFMANMSNGGLGVWRFLSWIYMELMGQPGQVFDLKMSRSALALWTAVSGLICLAILLAFASRMGLQRGESDSMIDGPARRRWIPAPVTRWPAADAVFAFLTLGALVVSQFGPHAHINHSYAAMVLLTVWVLRDRVLARLWLAMVVMLGVAHVSTFGFGDAHVMLPPSQLLQYPHAGALIDRIVELPAYRVPDGLLVFQATANKMSVLSALALSMMSAPVFIVACCIIWRMYRSLAQTTGVLPQPPLFVVPAANKAAGCGEAQGRSAPPSGT